MPTYEVVDERFTEVDIDLDHECGYVTDPEFHDGRSDRQMRLAVYRIFATREEETGSPIFFLDGGPGSSMKGMLTANNGNIRLNLDSPDERGTTMLDMLRNHDIVMMSQRGAEFSQPAVLTCPEGEDGDLIALLENLSPSKKTELTLRLYEDCIAEWNAKGEADVALELTEAVLDVGLAHMIDKTAAFIPAMLEETAEGTGRFPAEMTT